MKIMTISINMSVWFLARVGNDPKQSEAIKFYEVDAMGDDYVDFGAATGPKGAFSWHATYRLEQ